MSVQMAEVSTIKKPHKEWRKEVKKLRRKRIRQKLAEERNKKLAEEEAALKKDPNYQSWLCEQQELEAAELEQERRQRQEQEELWLRRELIAQKVFREQKRKEEATQAVKEAERQRIQKEFDEIQRQAQKRREERQQREEQAQREHAKMMDKIADYVEVGGAIPEELTSNVQSNPSKPTCSFFSKTNACRFKMQCCRNHIRPKLSRILFFPNFFSHIKLEQAQDTEYGSDINLECTDKELYDDYTEFFNDIVDELKKFGEIIIFRTCMNSQPHLRGNVLVEYKEERDALRAYMKLQGRYYASRRINVEFSPITSWSSAVCGLSYSNKCPKGRDCNFMHVFKNPGDMYNAYHNREEQSVKKPNPSSKRENSAPSWNDDDDRRSKRHWRWSESPEPNAKKTSEVSSRSSEHRSRKSSRPRSRSSRSTERRKSSHRSHSKERRSHCSSSTGHQENGTSSRKRKDRASRSKSPRKRHKDHKNRKRSHKEKKRKHKSKSSSRSRSRSKISVP